MKIVITESQYRVLFNRPNEVIFGGINEIKKSTIDDFKANVPKEHRNPDGSLKYIYPDEFDGTKKPITLTCPKEGHGPFKIEYAEHHITHSQGCPECKREKKAAEFRKKATSMKIHQNEDGSPKYIYPDKFDGMNKPIKLTCPKEGHGPFEVGQAVNHIVKGQGCPECRKEKKAAEFSSKRAAEFRKRAISMKIHQNEDGSPKYIYPDKFDGGRKPITLICPKEGHGPFKIEYAENHITHSQGCPECEREEREDKFIKNAQQKHQYGGKPIYTYDNVKGKYVNGKTEVSITCPKDGHGDFPQTPGNHLNGKGCPKCKESKGEKIIREYLTSVKEYNPVPQMTFSGCTNAHRGTKICRQYEFDIYIPEKNTIIEYDGVQHFKDVAYFKNCDLNCRITIDKYKNEYCKDKGIKMIRISYKTYKKEEIEAQVEEGLKNGQELWIPDNYPKEGWNK